MKFMIGTYTIRHPTGVYYFGQTKDFSQRQVEHLKKLKRNIHPSTKLQEAFNSDPTFEWSIEETTDISEAMALEEYHLSVNKGDPLLANTHGNCYTTELVKMCTGNKQTPETIQKRVDKTRGMKRTTETKDRISQALKENPVVQANMSRLHEKAKRPVTVSGVQYSSVKEAAIAHDISSSTVLQRINSANFHEWSY